MDKSNTTFTIVCPACKQKQTGILKVAEHALGDPETETVIVRVGDPYIICCMNHCKHLISGDELDEVTRVIIKGPSDLNRY